LTDWFASRFYELARRNGLQEADLVVPVPLHRVRQRERGFNQAESCRSDKAKRLKLPLEAILLVSTG